MDFEPTPRQAKLWEHIAEAEPGSLTLIGYGGAAGGGKSKSLAELAIDLALDFPGNRIVVGRKDYSDLRTTTMEEFYRSCPRELISRQNDSEHWCRVRMPDWPEDVYTQIFFSEMKDHLSLGSEEYGVALLDEAGEIPEASALMLLSRLRWQPRNDICPPMKYVIVAASNPWPGWFERWFINREMPEEVLREANVNVHFVPAYIRDNPHLPENYEAVLRATYPADWVARLVEGRFDVYEGQVYEELSADQQWSYALPKFKRIVGGLDFGGARPNDHFTAGVVAGVVDRDQPGIKENSIVRFTNFEDGGPGVHSRLMEWMAKTERSVEQPIMWCADRSQTWGISLVGPEQMGFNVVPSKGGPGSVEQGIVLVKTRFADKGSYYTPNLTVAPSPVGRSWFERMRNYRWGPSRDDNKSLARKPIEREDDTCDADRYMHELVDAFPTVGRHYGIYEHTISGDRRATKAV